MSWPRRLAMLVAVSGLLAVPGALAAQGRSLALTVAITGKGAVRLSTGRQVSCAASCKRMVLVRAGSRVALTSQPASGWKFGTWAGACRGTAATCKVRVTRAARVGVTFLAPGVEKNPIALGQAGAVRGGWQVKVVSVTPDATQQILRVTYPNGELANSPPPAGAQDFMISLSVTYTGGGKGTFGVEYNMHAVGSHQASYTVQDDWCGRLPDPNFNDGAGQDVFSGQTATGNVCFQIASNDADSLALDVRDVWFALR